MSTELLTAKELGERLKVQTGTIKAWARRGVIPCLRPTPKILRFNLADVLHALKENPRSSEATNG